MVNKVIKSNEVTEELLCELAGEVAPEMVRRLMAGIDRLGIQFVRAAVANDTSQAQLLFDQILNPDFKVAELLQLWQTRNAEQDQWQRPAIYAALAKRLIDLGVPFSAREVADAGLAFAYGMQRLQLRHLLGLALGRCGLVDAASLVLSDPELGQLPRNEETRGLEAALQKQLGLRAGVAEVRQRHLRASLELYNAAWKADDGSFWTGINVASLHLLLGQREQAATIARQVETECLAEDDVQRNSVDDDPYWRWATIAEAKLNQGEVAKAEEWYRRVAGVAHSRVGHLNSTRRQLRHLFAAIGESESLVDEWLPIPGVAIFTGHRIDAADRATPRFPAELEASVKDSILQWLVQHNVRSCVCSAANGADILFLEALQSFAGCDTRIVLPFPETAFIKESVLNGADESWVARFMEVMRRASRVTIASSDRIGAAGLPFEYANRIIFGQGRILADELQTSLLGLAVWNGVAGDGVGGTGHAIGRWRQQGLTVYTIDLSNLQSSSSQSMPLNVRCNGEQCEIVMTDNGEESPIETVAATPLMSMLFADVVGFSKLSDHEVKLFITHFLGRVASCVGKFAPDVVINPDLWSGTAVMVRETWGDGLYFAFRDVQTAGCFALDLCDAVSDTKWSEQFGFSHDLAIRIALHSGPAHLSVDPITGLPKCTGIHVSRAARLEPKTPPNHVYASDAFASLAAEEQVTDFKCEFVKLMDWAKHYGSYPTYVLTRPGSA